MGVLGPRRLPVLMCLNLQEVHLQLTHPLYVPGADRVLTRAHRCLKWARALGLPIVHVHTLRADGAAPLASSPPIPGFEPRSSESVILKRTHSFFHSAEFARLEGLGLDIFVLGFAATLDCLASAIDADRHGVRLAFISDAIASTAVAPFGPDIVDAVLLGVLSQFASQISSEELIARSSGGTSEEIALRLAADASNGRGM